MAPRANGWTLLECLVAFAVGAVCLALALPAWRDALQARRVRAATQQLADTLRLARLDARQHARSVRVCPSADGRSCQAHGRWERGWVALAQTGEPAPEPVAVQVALPGVRIDASGVLADGAGFDPAGWPRRPNGALLMGRWRVCPWPAMARVAGRELVMGSSGHLREQALDCARPGA